MLYSTGCFLNCREKFTTSIHFFITFLFVQNALKIESYIKEIMKRPNSRALDANLLKYQCNKTPCNYLVSSSSNNSFNKENSIQTS